MFRKRTLKERFWEMLPGLQFWMVFFGAILLSYYKPVWAALFIICFDLYWVLKALNVASHLIASYRKFQFFIRIDWLDFAGRLNDPATFHQYLHKQELTTANSLEKNYFKQEQKRLESLIS